MRCRVPGDERNYGAYLKQNLTPCANCLSSSPSTNRFPSNTTRIHFAPSSRRQIVTASRHGLETIDNVALRNPKLLVSAVRSLPVAKVDSIGLVVWI